MNDNVKGKRLSVIIVTFNSENLIMDCLDSIFKYNDIHDDLEVVLVDNCSKEYLSMFTSIKEKYHDRVVLISNKMNGGYGQGNNVGIKASKAPVVLIMNPDVRLVKPVFKKLLHLFERQDLAIVGMQQYESLSKRSQSFLMLKETVFSLLLHKIYTKVNRFNENYFCISGACFAIRKSVFIKVGMFDEQMFLYGEERMLHYKILKLGNYHVLYDSTVGYLHPKENRAFSSDSFLIGFQSFMYTCDKLGLDLYESCVRMINMYKFLVFSSWIRRDKSRAEYYGEIIELIKNNMRK